MSIERKGVHEVSCILLDAMADGRPIFGGDSPHDIGKHLEKVCAEQPCDSSVHNMAIAIRDFFRKTIDGESYGDGAFTEGDYSILIGNNEFYADDMAKVILAKTPKRESDDRGLLNEAKGLLQDCFQALPNTNALWDRTETLLSKIEDQTSKEK